MKCSGILTGLYHYPIRGMSAQALDSAALTPEQGMGTDRIWALARSSGDALRLPEAPLPSFNYHGPTYDPRLTGIRTVLDPVTETLAVFVQEHLVLQAPLSTSAGRTAAEELFARVLDLDAEDAPRLLKRQDTSYTYSYTAAVDPSMAFAVHLVNLASVREFSRRIGAPVDPLRFRPNLVVDLGEPWVERSRKGWLLEAGELTLRQRFSTVRCAATEVNLTTAELDLPVPRLLMQHYGHSEMGVYATAETSGTLRVGDLLTYREDAQ